MNVRVCVNTDFIVDQKLQRAESSLNRTTLPTYEKIRCGKMPRASKNRDCLELGWKITDEYLYDDFFEGGVF